MEDSPALTRIERIRSAIESAFSPVFLEIQDDSMRHAGHPGAGPNPHATHLRITLAAEAFEPLSRVDKHRLVNDCLSPFFAEGLHAVSLYFQKTPVKIE